MRREIFSKPVLWLMASAALCSCQGQEPMVISEAYSVEGGYFSMRAELKNNTSTPVELLLNCFSQVGFMDKSGNYIEMPLHYNYEDRQSVKFDVCIESGIKVVIEPHDALVYESGKIKINPEVDLSKVGKVKFATLGKVLSGPESVQLRTTSDDLIPNQAIFEIRRELPWRY